MIFDDFLELFVWFLVQKYLQYTRIIIENITELLPRSIAHG